MSHDPRKCDELFVEIERSLSRAAWEEANAAFERFSEAMLSHFSAEESRLFPAFEERRGMRIGPTQVMRSEHAQMRQLIEAAEAAIAEHDADDYSGYPETLLIMMQQHKMKEENVLYPMCEEHLADQSASWLKMLESRFHDHRS